jgi:hypothetical protein
MDLEKTKDRVEEDGSSNIASEMSRDPEDGPSLDATREKNQPNASLELSRTVSNALSRVTTRMTNRHITDPGPPPGRPINLNATIGSS